MPPPLLQMRLAHHIPAKGLVGATPGNALGVIGALYSALDGCPNTETLADHPVKAVLLDSLEILFGQTEKHIYQFLPH